MKTKFRIKSSRVSFLAVTVLAGILLHATAAHAVRFRLPLSSDTGVHYYYDHNTSSGITAWNCSGTSYNGHQGTDYSGGPRGRAILASANGTLNYKIDGFGDGYAGSTAGGGAGNHVRIDHGGGVMTWYMHMTVGSVTGKSVGSGIACSEQIGGVGTSGSSTGLHLHFDLRLSGARRDPYIGSCGGLGYWVNQGSGSPSTTCENGRAIFGDYDGDRKADAAVFRPSNGTWNLSRTAAGAISQAFGYASDIVAPSDYDGDGKIDLAVWRPSNGTWYIQGWNNNYWTTAFGANGDMPIPGDYDGDGKSDAALFRPSTGYWYFSGSTGASWSKPSFGYSTDIPIPADYDGDGKFDAAIWRPSNGNWYFSGSAGQYWEKLAYGYATDIPVPGDYDGDGRADAAVWRPSNATWYISPSSGTAFSVGYGANGDIPVPTDYDGDGKYDAAVWRPSNATWYISKSTGGSFSVQYGQSGDRPLNLTSAIRNKYFP